MKIVVKKAEQGFFTLETVYAAIALVAVMATVGMYMQGCRMVMASTNLTIATCLAQKQLACVQANDALIKDDKPEIYWQDVDVLPLQKNSPSFTMVTTVKKSSANNKLKEINVLISWQEFGISKQIAVSTLAWING